MTIVAPPPLDNEDEEMLVPHSEFADGAQPMEVTPQPEAVATVENQPIEDPPSSRYTWMIDNFSRLTAKKQYSDVFVVGGYKWRVLIFPKGNNVDHLSMYLDVADSTTLPYGWSRYAQFSLAIVNQIHNKYTVRKDTQHQFYARESDWGFTSFMPLSELYDPIRGYLVNDTCIVEAEVVVRWGDHLTYNSKKETGYVGLKNQGATCYMNSLLQTLYHIPYFRKAVYHMPTTENDMPAGSIPLALQSLFYKLQYSDNSVATKELTKSFGWDTYDSFMQHDVQELNRVLCEKLEDKMKGTVVEGTIQQLFEGHHMNYIECINVDYKSTRKESFYDLQLDVKGCQDVYASFDKYVEVERLEGDNKYHAEQHGLQDARKGVLFIDFPPVLQLQLKRFEYDFMRDTMVKINDRYEFPLQLDLDRDNGKYLSPDADRRVRNLYTLHSVLVHSGGVHGGHYYAFIRPTLSDKWFKFDDERVTKEDMKRALEEQYGGEEELPQTNPGFNNTPFKFTKYSNAYMLVYIRESDKEKIICNVDEKDIAEHLRSRLKREQEEKEHKKKEKAEAHLYTIIKVARNEDLAEQVGKDIYFDLVDHDKVRSFRIQKQMPFNLFKEEVAKEFGIPVQFHRFWLWAKRQNHTYRPNRPLTHQEETQSVGQLREVSNKFHNAELKLFLEVELGPDLRPLLPPDKTKDDIMLFFKLYDPSKEQLRYMGRLFVKGGGKPAEIITKLNEMAGFSSNEDIELFEEIKFEPTVMCEPIDKKLTFRASQLEDGDIICFQRPTTVDRCRYPDIPSFLEYVHNRQIVHFRSLEKPKEDDFRLELSKLFTYDDVVERVAQQLDLDDPSKIRLTSHNCYSQQPKPQPIKYRGVDHLSDMLVHYNQTSDILYYEVLDIPLPELQGLKTLKVAFHHATKDEVVIHSIRLPKQSTVGDVINDLKTKVELSHPNAELRLLEVFYHKIYKIFPPGEKIENINDQYWTLRAEEVLAMENGNGRSLSGMYGSICNFLRRCFFRVLSYGPIPKHIAFIMDGNRRFARSRNLKEGFGHRVGFMALMSILQYCYELGVKYVTVYAFSIDNFNRKPDEVQYVMDLMQEKIEELIKEESIVNKYGIKINFFGNLNLLNEPVRRAAERAMAATAGNTQAVFSVCVAYTSTDEIVHSVNESCIEKRASIRQVNLNSNGASDNNSEIEYLEGDNFGACVISLADLERHMYTAGCPGPDILIRTSGEARLSNFLLWQTTFCYLLAPDALWPEISLRHLVWAILEYQRVQPYLEKKKKQL